MYSVWVRLSLLFGVLGTVLSISFAGLDSMSLQPDNSPNCTMNCTGAGRSVCATDGRTYNNMCELKKAQCFGHPIHVQHLGNCKGSRCLAEKAHAIRISHHSLPGVFIPNCTPQGTYAQVQCHQPTDYCWCVTSDGRPVPGSSTRSKKPRCKAKGCSQSDRSAFNGNLMKIFITEYNRLPSTSGVDDDRLVTTKDKAVIDWQFQQLDTNRDNFLDRREYKDLRRLIKKFVKPRRCAKTFTRVCDSDGNKVIDKKEWSRCLGVDINNQGLHDFPMQGEDPTMLTSNKKPQEGPDCMLDRQNALEEDKHSEGTVYIPNCTNNGKYEQIQCFSDTGFCWCVNPDNGAPIHGTSVKDKKPNCDTPPVMLRPMKGCQRKKKARFLTALLDILTTEMVEAAKNTSSAIIPTDADPDKSFEQQVAEWEFTRLDTNQNRVLDRGEWKHFRRWAETYRKLKKCGRKLPKHCDSDNNRMITLDEWATCLNVKGNVKNAGLPFPPKRKGPNPLKMYLKSDDDA